MKFLYLILLIDSCYSQLDGGFWWLKDDNANKKDVTKAPILTSTFSDTVTNFKAKLASSSPLHEKDVICCECVNFYSCVNGTINTDGTGLIDVRLGKDSKDKVEPVVNVDICPGEFDVCCQVPDADPSCIKEDNILSSTETSVTYFTPHPESNCECLSYSACPPDLVVSDGLGQTSIELSNGRTVNHSKCLHALEVCCYLPEIFAVNETESSSSTMFPSEGEGCECVPRYLCTPDGYINTDGEGILDLRIGPNKPLKKCPTNPDQFCCLPPPPETNTTGEPRLPPPVIPPPDCGQRNLNGLGVRILGFKEGQTQFGEFPWVATLLRKELVMGVIQPLFLGGASLVHQRVVVTAAHKVHGIPREKLIIRLGEWDTASMKEFLPHQDVGVQEVIIHPGFVQGPLFHDVALLILNEEAKSQYNIWPICPAKSLNEINESSCVINGWGVDAFSFGEYQHIMKSITLPLVRREKCEKLLRKTRLSKYFRLHSSFICAGGEEGIDACKGDGGGPLACPRIDDPSKYVQVGITAWGIGCGTKDVPGVYVDITQHYDWIINNINRLFPGLLYESTSIVSSSSIPVTIDENAPEIDVRIQKTPRRQQLRQRRREIQLRRQRQNQRRNNRRQERNTEK